jgi:hypothetical protein
MNVNIKRVREVCESKQAVGAQRRPTLNLRLRMEGIAHRRRGVKREWRDREQLKEGDYKVLIDCKRVNRKATFEILMIETQYFIIYFVSSNLLNRREVKYRIICLQGGLLYLISRS